MTRRILPVMVAVLALAWLCWLPAQAQQPPGQGLQQREGTHEGKVVKVEKDKLTMTGKNGKDQHSHIVPADAKITCDGKVCKLEDLKKDYQVKVTIERKDNQLKVTKIEAKST